MGWYGKFLDRAFRPVDIASLIFFRVAFGAILLWEVWRYFSQGWIKAAYIAPGFHFKYYGFEWVQPWTGDGMYWHFAAVGALAVFIMAGALYRLAMALFVAAFGYIFLLDQTFYLNHIYLVLLVAVLMCLIPAHRAISVDAWLRPSVRSATAPAWALWVLRLQFELMFLYAGFVKLNGDWLQLQPLAIWLGRNTGVPIIGPLFGETWVIAVAAYGVIALHLIGAPLLLWRRTRPWVFILYLCFNLFNHFQFNIGIFPWFTIAGTLMFFEPDWPKRLLRRLKSWTGAAFISGGAAAAVRPMTAAPLATIGAPPAVTPPRKLLLSFLLLMFTFQILFPLRHFLYPGNVAWTEEGHRFAWRMMLRTKKAKATFQVRDPATGRIWEVAPERYLIRRQVHKMANRPDMVLQFAHYLADRWRIAGHHGVEVRANVFSSLNGRAPAQLIDPERDCLTSAPMGQTSGIA